MTDLDLLAERCEKAAGRDLDIDHEIGRALGADGNYSYRPFTASLDAAITLYLHVPERVPSNPRLAAAEGLRQRADNV